MRIFHQKHSVSKSIKTKRISLGNYTQMSINVSPKTYWKKQELNRKSENSVAKAKPKHA